MRGAAERARPRSHDDRRSCERCRWSRSSRSAARPPYLGPVKDGRSLPRDPFDPDAPPQSAHIPMILGNTKGETRTLIGRGDPSLFSLTWETLLPKLEANSPFMGTLDRGEVIAKYREWHPRVLAGRRLLRGDDRFAIVARPGDRSRSPRRAAGRLGADATCSSSTGRRRSTAASGARITASTCRSSSTTPPSRRIMVGAGAEQVALADLMSRAWIAFARTGNPNATGLPAWPAFDLTASRHDGVRSRIARRRRSARPRTPVVWTGAVCAARNVRLTNRAASPSLIALAM